MGKVMPSARSAVTPRGKMPSPHGLSIGGVRASRTVARRPRWLAAIAAAMPAGPAPTTMTSLRVITRGSVQSDASGQMEDGLAAGFGERLTHFLQIRIGRSRFA